MTRTEQWYREARDYETWAQSLGREFQQLLLQVSDPEYAEAILGRIFHYFPGASYTEGGNIEIRNAIPLEVSKVLRWMGIRVGWLTTGGISAMGNIKVPESWGIRE